MAEPEARPVLLWVGASGGLAAQGLAVVAAGLHLQPVWQALSAGIAILGAAFLLSWAAELAQFDIPQSLAIAFLALIAVLPEYAVDIYLAWQAGKDPSYIPKALANMTGANRLLVGAGWASVVFFFWYRTRQRAITVETGLRLELVALIAATLYAFLVPLIGRLSLIDSIIFVAIFAWYILRASQGRVHEPELEGPAEWLATLPAGPRRAVTVVFFAFAGLTIWVSAAPFVEGLLAAGRAYGIDEFLLVQWVAPFASEAPEFVVAILFAWRLRPEAGLGTLISSLVNQWTLLVGTLPLAFALSGRSLAPMPLDARQVGELFLTAAQCLFAVVVLVNFSFSLWEGGVLAALFVTHLMLPDPHIRQRYAWAYVALAIVLALTRENRRAIRALLGPGLAGRGIGGS